MYPIEFAYHGPNWPPLPTPAHHGHSALPLQWNLLKEVNYFPPDSRRCAWQRGPAAWSGQHQHLINLRYFQFSVLIDQINKLCFLGWPQWPGLTRSAHWSCNDWRCISPSSQPSSEWWWGVRSHVDKQFHQFYKQLNSVTWVMSLHLSMATAAVMWCNVTRAVNEIEIFTIFGEGLY